MGPKTLQGSAVSQASPLPPGEGDRPSAQCDARGAPAQRFSSLFLLNLLSIKPLHVTEALFFRADCREGQGLARLLSTPDAHPLN